MASAVVPFHGHQLVGMVANRVPDGAQCMRPRARSWAASYVPLEVPSLRRSAARLNAEWMNNGGAALNLSRGAGLRMNDERRRNGAAKRVGVRCSASGSSTARPASQPRFIQHKQEAFWFYRFLSIVYDHIINPGHWTEDMREDALEPADLNDPNLVVVDVGGGTGFTTLGIVKTVNAKNVTILDQSPHQLAKAKEKEPLKECTIVEGDAEDLPFATDYADRYVSAGSIEYWPDPQRGIKEAYRVIKPGGKACLIGPVHQSKERIASIQGVVLSTAHGFRSIWGKRDEKWKKEDTEDYAMYEGVVWHERKHPVRHQFKYKVRYALVNLNKLPSWFVPASRHHMSAQQARSTVGSSGPVHLLCIPASVGYEQNPLGVYYCYDDAGNLAKAIAEVTNTPWGERAIFVFDPTGDTVAKPLHVSPFMDMAGSWLLHAPLPGEKLTLTIRVHHPEFGNYFVATLRAKKVIVENPENFSWLMPHKVAIWIYWQALVLVWKGVAFVPHPKYVDGDAYRKRAQIRDEELRGTSVTKEFLGQAREGERAAGMCKGSVEAGVGPPRFCTWREAAGPPWL